ncbi:hypothetical protein D3C71_2091610 [compost metagenome]
MRRNADTKGCHMAASRAGFDLQRQITDNNLIHAGDQTFLASFRIKAFLPHLKGRMREL